VRINVGCGQMPMEGWRNFDTSFSVVLAKSPLLAKVLRGIKLLRHEQYEFIQFIQTNPIEYANVAKRIPVSDSSADVIYNSHMIEHLDREEVINFLGEARRVLKPGGIIRCVIPDTKIYVSQYIENGDANALVDGLLTCQPYPKTLVERVKKFIAPGRMHHLWMYDGQSLCELLQAHGFVNAVVLDPGATRINHPEGLDLSEKVGFSAYVEAEKAFGIHLTDGPANQSRLLEVGL
jgi:predicted SAM-dependent methyltransferase